MPSLSRPPFRLALLASFAAFSLLTACPEPRVPDGGPTERSAVANRWFERARTEFRALELPEAADSVAKARAGAPQDREIALLAGRIALTRLDYATTISSLEGVDGAEAASLRARAYWYSDDLANAGQELSRALEDPDFKDPWAKPVRDLATTQGRKPFSVTPSSARLVEVRMPRDLGLLPLVTVEIDGRTTVALVVTGVPELVLDQKARTKAGWVTVKFASSTDPARYLEMRDVPALVQDLSAFSAQQAVPIGALLGVNLLRRLHLTLDRRADQFIVRRDSPPAPTAMTTVPVGYVKGGGMVVRATLRGGFEFSTGMWIHSGGPFGLALPTPTWKKLGIDPRGLGTFNGVTHGRLDDIRVGNLDLGPIEGVLNDTQELTERLQQLDLDAMGALGGNFLASLRVTLEDGGRSLWLETDPWTSSVLAPTLTGPSERPTPASSTAADNPPPPPTPATTATPSKPPVGAAKPPADQAPKAPAVSPSAKMPAASVNPPAVKAPAAPAGSASK